MNFPAENYGGQPSLLFNSISHRTYYREDDANIYPVSTNESKTIDFIIQSTIPHQPAYKKPRRVCYKALFFANYFIETYRGNGAKNFLRKNFC